MFSIEPRWLVCVSLAPSVTAVCSNWLSDRQGKLPELRFPTLPLFQALRDQSGNKTAASPRETPRDRSSPYRVCAWRTCARTANSTAPASSFLAAAERPTTRVLLARVFSNRPLFLPPTAGKLVAYTPSEVLDVLGIESSRCRFHCPHENRLTIATPVRALGRRL